MIDIEGLIAASSLGTPDAVAMRARTSDERAAAIVARAEELAAADGVALQKAADLLRLAAAGRLEYAASCPEGLARDTLETEASTLRHAADVVEGDLRPLYGWLPSWRWTDEMNAQMRETP